MAVGTSIAVVDKELTARLPIFLQVLPPQVSPQRLMRTVIMSCERLPALLQCSPQSIINAATTAAVLGLECDGVTGQGFLIPYKGVATFQIGYKGYNTLAARAGYTINGGVVREGDAFDYQLGTGGYVRHKPIMESMANRRILAAWAVAESLGRPNIVVVMSIDEVLAIKAKSPGAKRTDSPWNDERGPGFPAMVEKTAKRRLARSMPLSVQGMQQAAALEEQHELGRAAHLMPGGDMRVVGEATVAAPSSNISDAQPEDILSPANGPDLANGEVAPFQWTSLANKTFTFATAGEWRDRIIDTLSKIADEKMHDALAINVDGFNAHMIDSPNETIDIFKAFADRGIYPSAPPASQSMEAA